MNNKTEKIEVRITKEQKKLIKDLQVSLGYKSISKYVISRAISPVVFIKRNKPYVKFSADISKIGYNVNQIAKKVNSFDKVMDSDIKELQDEISKMKNIIDLIEEDFKENEKFIRVQYDERSFLDGNNEDNSSQD
ncbi:plasmid mobilization protein [Aerococcus viridans]|uniref:plasmid mobilization protein n=1 Tax=Aerococcus viridans TaxID=1377 RepID=UPI003B2178E1